MSKKGQPQWGREKLIDWARHFIEETGELPRADDLPVTLSTIRYHFGSLRQFKKSLVEPKAHWQRSDGNRYCLTCGKLLPLWRFHFCPEPPEQLGMMGTWRSCESTFLEDGGLNNGDWGELEEKVDKCIALLEHSKLWKKCWNCPKKCEGIYLRPDQDEPPAKITCRKDPEFKAMAEKLGATE